MNKKGTVLLFAIMISVPGCLGVIYDTSDNREGVFIAEVVPEAPPNSTTINYSDERIQRNKYLVEAVQKAANQSGPVFITVPSEKIQETKEDVQGLPMYTVEDASFSDYEWGYYIRYNDVTVRVIFEILD